jgi:two-component system, cell cycle response regulator
LRIVCGRVGDSGNPSADMRVLPGDVFPGTDQLRVEYHSDARPTLILACSAQQASEVCHFANPVDEIGLLDESSALIARRLALLTARSTEAEQREPLTRLQYERDHDPLTGLLNRRAFLANVKKILEGFPPGALMGLVLLDLDNFKAINDTLGHAAGDEVLRKLAILIRGLTRIEDLFGRFGGDEFLILVAGGDEQILVSLVQRILDLIKSHEFLIGSNKVHVSASAGLVLLRAKADLNEMLLNADQSLYEAKASGRGRLVIFERLQDDTTARDEDLYLRNFENVIRVATDRVVAQITSKARSLLEAARRQADEDPVTGLKSRRYFEMRIVRDIESARRRGRALTVAMVDLDNFREINKQFRWTSADRALQKFAQIAIGHVRRPEDWVARWGGEEFLVVMPDADLKTGRAVAERIRREVEQCSVESIDRGTMRFTVSIGVARLTHKTPGAFELIDKAAKALGEAKSSGKNRIVAARDEGDDDDDNEAAGLVPA